MKRLILALVILVAAFAAADDRVVLTGVASTPGLAGTQWKSDLVLTTSSMFHCRNLDFAYLTVDGAEYQATYHLDSNLGGNARVDDVVGFLWPEAVPSSGSLVVTPPNGCFIDGYARTYNETANGTYGQVVDNVLYGQGRWLALPPAGGRVNVFLYNPGPYDNYIAANGTLVGVAAGWIEKHLDIGSEPLDIWIGVEPPWGWPTLDPKQPLSIVVSWVDNKTGDAATIPLLYKGELP